jgi:hypothetical protein
MREYDRYSWYLEQFGPEGYDAYEEHGQGD